MSLFSFGAVSSSVLRSQEGEAVGESVEYTWKLSPTPPPLGGNADSLDMGTNPSVLNSSVSEGRPPAAIPPREGPTGLLLSCVYGSQE